MSSKAPSPSRQSGPQAGAQLPPLPAGPRPRPTRTQTQHRPARPERGRGVRVVTPSTRSVCGSIRVTQIHPEGIQGVFQPEEINEILELAHSLVA